jgi:integrase/recombinase XerD
MQAKRVSPSTVHASARAVRAWVRFLEAEGYLEHAPRFDMPKVPPKAQAVLSPEEVRRLLAACTSERDKCLVLFLLDTGARRAEAVGVDWSDVNLQTGVVRLRQTKGGKPRAVILGARSRRALLRYRRRVAHADASPLFQTSDGLRLGYAGLREVLRRAGRRAGVKVTPHALRRTFATLALRGGMNLLHLSALMGHADLTMLRRYAVVVEEDLRKSHEEHGPVDSLLRG